MNSFEALLSIHFSVMTLGSITSRCSGKWVHTHPPSLRGGSKTGPGKKGKSCLYWHRIRNKITHWTVQFFPCLTLSWHTLINFRIHVIQTKLDFVSFDDKNLQRRREFVGERDFPIQNSYTDQVQCMSHRRDQKFVTSSVQSATGTRQRGLQQITDGCYRFFTILSWYSKVRDSESLLFQLAVNRD